MRQLTIAMSLIVATGVAAMAAEPAKTMATAGGKVFADMKGMTLYVFDKDAPGMSNCYDACAKNWPPFMARANAKPEGEWTLVDRKGGGRMWAYGGKPLYTFAKDKKAGDVTGDGVGGVWHLAKSD